MIESVLDTAKAVVTDPVAFYGRMQKSGGYAEPLTFVVAMGVVTGLVGIVMTMLGLGMAPTVGAAVVSAVLVPIFGAVLSFVGAGVLFLIWKLLGSQEPYETAYRCGAYLTAITPVTTVLAVLPYVGGIIGLAWAFYLLVVASEHVHAIPLQKARLVFAVLFVSMALMSVVSERTSRRLQGEMNELTEKMKELESMSPEDAGRAVGEFLKGLEDGAKPQ